jgi:hypothetical protein
MQQLVRLFLLAMLVAPILIGCGSKPAEGTPPPPGGERMSLEEAEKLRPKKRGGGEGD